MSRSGDPLPADIVAARHHSLPLPSPLAPGKHEYPGSENKDEVIPASRWDPDSFDDETRNARRGGNEEHEEPNTGTTTTKGKTNPEGWPSRAGAARRPRIMMSATRITAIGEGWRAGLRIYPANDPVRDEAGVEEEEEEEEGVFTRPILPPRSPLLASQQSAVRRCVFHLRNPQMDRRIPPFATVNIFSPSRLKVADEGGVARRRASIGQALPSPPRPWPRPASRSPGGGGGLFAGSLLLFSSLLVPLALPRDGNGNNNSRPRCCPLPLGPLSSSLPLEKPPINKLSSPRAHRSVSSLLVTRM